MLRVLKILRIVTSGIVFGLAIYSIITQNAVYMPYMLLLLGVSVLIMGVLELKAKRKTSAIISFFAVAFLFLLSFMLIWTKGRFI